MFCITFSEVNHVIISTVNITTQHTLFLYHSVMRRQSKYTTFISLPYNMLRHTEKKVLDVFKLQLLLGTIFVLISVEHFMMDFT